YMNAAVPASSTMYAEHPERVVAPGYMWMSGSSFASAAAAGVAAQILAMNPGWTPDQVKGALMVSAQPYSGSAYQLGVGVLSGKKSSGMTNPPNPIAGLDAYVVSDSNGGKAFDAASWASAAQSSASWNSSTWN